MSDYTIEGFWKRRLTVDRLSSRTLVQGWSLEDKGLATFKEAPLTRSTEFGEADPNMATVAAAMATTAFAQRCACD